MKILIYYSFTILLMILLVYCKSDNPTFSKTDMLTSKNWMVYQGEITLNGVTTKRTLENMTECEKDNYTKFEKSGTFKINYGTLKCDTDNDYTDGKWNFISNETQMAFQPPGTALYDTLDIVELTTKSFTTKYKNSDGSILVSYSR